MNMDEKLAAMASAERFSPCPATDVSAWVIRSIRMRGAAQANTLRIFAIASGIAAMLVAAIAISEGASTNQSAKSGQTASYSSLMSDAEAYVFADMEGSL